MRDISTLDRRIHSDLRANARAMGAHARIACFDAGFDLVSDNPYLNYAIPDDDAAPDGPAVAELISEFANRNRRPRLEYIPAAAPRVEPVLTEAGFAPEARLPIMICEPGAENSPWSASMRVRVSFARPSSFTSRSPSRDSSRDLPSSRTRA
jgi:hypothetical protein